MTEAVPVRVDLCRKNGVLSSANFMEVVKQHIIAPAKAGTAHVAHPCMLAEEYLTALPSWKEWLTFLTFINRHGLGGYVVFQNTRYRHDNRIFYPAEIRVYPALKVTK